MIKLKNKLKNNFIKNIMMITSGTVFSQVLNFALLPIITRIYPPEQYGVLSVYTSILVLISFIGSMNYELGIPIADSEDKAINVFLVSIITLIFFTSLLFFIFNFWGNSLLSLLNGESLANFKFLIPFGAFILGLYNIFSQWAYRNKDYKSLTKTKFTRSTTQNLVTISLGLVGLGPIGLILGKILGQSSGVLTLAHPIINKKRNLFKNVNKKTLLWSVKRYKNFPLFTTPRRALGDISITLPTLFITSLYGAQVVGLFGLANSVVQLPMVLIGSSVSNVFYAESASLRHTDPKQIKVLSNKLLKNLIFIGIIPLVALLFFGPYLFSLVFGNEWYEAGIYASILSFTVFSRLIFKPISNVFEIFEKQAVALYLNIIRLLLVLIAFGISSYFTLNSYWAIGLYSISMSIVYFLQYLLAQKIMNEEIKKI